MLQKWCFSTAMDSIKSWSLDEDLSVSEHLKTCPYNVRTRHGQAMDQNDEKWNEVLKMLTIKFKDLSEHKQQIKKMKNEVKS